jgi:hypothetical protein
MTLFKPNANIFRESASAGSPKVSWSLVKKVYQTGLERDDVPPVIVAYACLEAFRVHRT